jgi:serine/threonine-protein kinase RsbW
MPAGARDEDDARALRITIGTDPRIVGPTAARVRAFCGALGIAADDVALIDRCVTAALDDAVVHAYAGRDDGSIAIAVTLHGDTLSVAIEDSGNPVSMARLLGPRSSDPPGLARGPRDRTAAVALLRDTMDEVTYASASGVNTLTFARGVTFEIPPRAT